MLMVAVGCGPAGGDGDDDIGSDSGSTSSATSSPMTSDTTVGTATTVGPTTTLDDTGDGSGDDSSTDDGGERPPEGAVCPFPLEGAPDACGESTCFEMCGTRVLLRDWPATIGGGGATSPARRPYPAARVAHVGAAAIRSENFDLVVRDDMGVVLATIPFGGSVVAAVDDVTLIAALDGYKLVDLADPGVPIVHAAWSLELPTDGPAYALPRPDARYLGVSRGTFVFETPAGVSFVDAADPAAPFEVDCVAFPDDESIRAIGIGERALARARLLGEGDAPPPTVFIHDLDSVDPSTPVAEIAIGNESPYAYEADRLLLPQDGDVVLYDLGDAVPIEVGRTEWTYGAMDCCPVVVGGLAFVQPYIDGIAARVVDLRAAGDPGIYDGPTLDPTSFGESCTVTYEPVAGGESIALSPWYEPSARYDAAEPPEHPCPVSPNPTPWGWAGARSPDGERIAVVANDGVVVYDFATGEVGPNALQLGAEALYWLPGGLVGISSYQGDAEGSTILVRDSDDPSIDLGSFESRGFHLAGARSDDALWLLTRGGEQPGPQHILWSIPADDPFGPQIDAAVPADASLDAVAAGSAEVYGIDDDGRIFVFDLDGTLARTVLMPHGIEPQHVAASSLGVFVRGTDGVLQWLRPSSEAPLTDTAGCSERRPRAADDERLYVAIRDPGGTTWSSVLAITAVVPSPDDPAPGSFQAETITLQLPLLDGAVFPGPLTMVLGGTPLAVPW